ncbi:MAG: hypothetical protein JW751_20580 [Polyangiaceae bacterium]|nr:hypothetical protein [Polyangiaceae bacterium]
MRRRPTGLTDRCSGLVTNRTSDESTSSAPPRHVSTWVPLVAAGVMMLAAMACGGEMAETDEETGGSGSTRHTGGASGTGSSRATGGRTAADRCATLCDSGATVACPTWPDADCLAYCASLSVVPSGCQTTLNTYLDCLIRTGPAAFSCAADGSALIRSSACRDNQLAFVNCVLTES